MFDTAQFASACTSRPFDGTCDASIFQHMHCSVPECREPLFLTGDGGHEDREGRSAEICSGCGDEAFVLCPSCAAKDSRCGACRAEAAAFANCDEATCVDCQRGAA